MAGSHEALPASWRHLWPEAKALSYSANVAIYQQCRKMGQWINVHD